LHQRRRRHPNEYSRNGDHCSEQTSFEDIHNEQWIPRMVRQWQEFFWKKRYSHTKITSPDFVKLAEAYGIRGIRVTSPDEVESTIKAR